MNCALYLFACASLVLPIASQTSVPPTTQQDPPGGTSTLTTMRNSSDSSTKELVRTEHYDFPIAKDKELFYFDVSEVQNLTLFKNDQNVQGITAKMSSCKLQEMNILTGYRLDKDNLIKNCKNLHRVTLEGTEWPCRGSLWQFVEELRGKITYEKAVCGDVRCVRPTGFCSLEHGMNISRSNGLKDIHCPDPCKCYTRDLNGLSNSVDCKEMNLTDDSLPLKIPLDTTQLILSNNQFQSAQKLFEDLAILTEVKVIYLEKNKIDAFPFFKKDSFPKLELVFLQNNQIKKINSKAVESILNARKNATQFDLENNPILCSQDIYEINVLQITRHYVICDWNHLQCYDDNKKKNTSVKFLTQKLRKNVSGAELDPWIVFICFASAMNIFFVYIIYDLSMAIREVRLDVAGRRPILDKIICGISNGCSSLWHLSCQQREYESCDSSAVFYRGPDQVAIRRRTPRPAEE